MAIWIDSIKTARDGFALQLEEIAADPLKPSYVVDGQDMEWTAAIEALTNRIMQLTTIINGQEPFELLTTGVT